MAPIPDPRRLPWTTNFRVEEKYKYLEGLGNYHSSEAIAGALPAVINSPQKPPFGLKTERVSGSSFVTSRHLTTHTWLYRIRPTLFSSEAKLVQEAQDIADCVTPDSYSWPTFGRIGSTFVDQKLLASNGDSQKKTGCAIWLFSADTNMPDRTAFCSLDGESLIVPQTGTLDIQTELGNLLVRQNEFAMIPRGIRYRVRLAEGAARGYMVELFQGQFRLPELGPIGTTGLANTRDFKVPVASCTGELVDGTVRSPPTGPWEILSRLAGRLWLQSRPTTPFDVAAWHGTNYPYKFCLSHFCVLANGLFDEHDPSLYTVLTAPNGSSQPGHAVLDFAIIPPRWQVAEATLWLPYYHRNTMCELAFPVVSAQDGAHPLNRAQSFAPFGAVMHSAMAPHGATEEELKTAEEIDTMVPQKLMEREGFVVVLVETEVPLVPSRWAVEQAKRMKGKDRGKL